ncbi:MAG: prolyl oligopeptidase family serine peptidase, partial [Bacteroidia bacterium]
FSLPFVPNFLIMNIGKLSLCFLFSSIAMQAQQSNYPKTRRDNSVRDTYHGTTIEDPYRWLENDTSAETGAWVKEQNKVSFDYLDKIPYRNKFRDRITELLNYPRFSAPFRVGEYYFYSKNDGLQNQSVYYKQKGMNGEPEVFLDPNKMSEKGTVSVSLTGTSHDDKYIVYSVSSAGSDWSELRIKEVATGKDLPDIIKFVKFSGAAFRGDGFYYSRYPEPGKGTELSGQNQFHAIWFHKLGTPQTDDKLIFEDRQHPLRYHSAELGQKERFLVLSVSEGTDGNELHVMDLAKGDTKFNPLISGFDFSSGVVDQEGDRLLVITNVDAPNYKLVSIDPANPGKENWKTIIAEQPELLKAVTKAGDVLFAHYLKDVTTRIIQYTRNGISKGEILLPGVGSASGFDGERDDKEVFYTFTSFNYPPTIFRYNLASGASDLFRKTELKFEPADYEVKQVFVPSKDGKAKVPMFIVHRKGLKLDGQRPTLLYAYGGFNISLEPGFSPSRIAFMENDGVFVQANLRGGGEYGEEWHKAGMFGNKQNVFDDFIACAEWLQANGYTSKDKLAIQGGSNGGLLVGACMTQRPDLFKVAIPQVGVLDMLRFQKFTVGWGWVDEYGTSEKAEDFKWLIKYSPLHNIREIAYPATLVMTADHDDRVVPAHSFKFISELQHRHKGTNPVMIRIETDAGHGAGVALSKTIQATADVYSFIFFNTQSPVKY